MALGGWASRGPHCSLFFSARKKVLLETTALDQKQRECVEAIQSSGSSLLTLINDVLDMSKLEADRLVLEHIPYNARECAEQAANVLQLKAEEKGLELVVCVMATAPRRCVGDPSRLTQVLLNLLRYAYFFCFSFTLSFSFVRFYLSFVRSFVLSFLLFLPFLSFFFIFIFRYANNAEIEN